MQLLSTCQNLKLFEINEKSLGIAYCIEIYLNSLLLQKGF